MTRFLRPGEKVQGAFGISFATDRDTAGSIDGSIGVDVFDQGARKSLPIAKHRQQLMYLVETHATTIIVGETGSGKTTQVPQYLVDTGWAAGGRRIACTQPRRVAAMGVAARVAQEMGCALGREVGYSIRFEEVSTPNVTKIKFCTDGVLLKEMIEDPLLSAYSVVIVDEAHERSTATDILLGLLKKVQKVRPDLRVIISSATLEARGLASFFKGLSRGETDRGTPTLGEVSRTPAIISVEGRTFDVQVHYAEVAAADYVQSAVEAALAIHQEELPGDILIFLTGQAECERAVAMLEEEARKQRHGRQQLRLMPAALFAGLPAANQLAALNPAPRGYRKVIAATNIAETSLTIEGTVYVIDCMFAKQTVYNPVTGLESLLVAPISKASASQRAGRAGRVRPGHAFRLCTEEAFKTDLASATVPELQRGELAGTVLQLKALGVDNVMTFDYLAPPPAQAMVKAAELLFSLGAIDEKSRLTNPLGVRMTQLALDPRLAAALLAADGNGCTDELLTVAAMLSVQSIWVGGRQNRKATDAAKLLFAAAEGDLVTYLNVWRGWEEGGRTKRWCAAHMLNYHNFLRAADIRRQLIYALRRMGIKQSSCDSDPVPVRRALCAGLFSNAARLVGTAVTGHGDPGTPEYQMLRLAGPGQPKVRLRAHPSSVLFRVSAPWVLFYQAKQGESGWYDMHDLVTVEPEWLPELAPHMFSKSRPTL